MGFCRPLFALKAGPIPCYKLPRHGKLMLFGNKHR